MPFELKHGGLWEKITGCCFFREIKSSCTPKGKTPGKSPWTSKRSPGCWFRPVMWDSKRNGWNIFANILKHIGKRMQKDSCFVEEQAENQNKESQWPFSYCTWTIHNIKANCAVPSVVERSDFLNDFKSWRHYKALYKALYVSRFSKSCQNIEKDRFHNAYVMPMLSIWRFHCSCSDFQRDPPVRLVGPCARSFRTKGGSELGTAWETAWENHRCPWQTTEVELVTSQWLHWRSELKSILLVGLCWFKLAEPILDMQHHATSCNSFDHYLILSGYFLGVFWGEEIGGALFDCGTLGSGTQLWQRHGRWSIVPLRIFVEYSRPTLSNSDFRINILLKLSHRFNILSNS